MRKSKTLILSLATIVAIESSVGLVGCSKKSGNEASPAEIESSEEDLENLDKVIYDGVKESKSSNLSKEELEESEAIAESERESLAADMESLSDILNERTNRNHADSEGGTGGAENSDGASVNGKNGLVLDTDKNTDTTLEETKPQQPDYSDDEEVKQADTKLNKPNDALTITDVVEFKVAGNDNYDTEQVAKVGDIWVYISPAIVDGGYAVLNNGNQCRIAIGTAENYQSYCDIYELHKGEFDRSLITDKFVAQKIRDTYGLANGMLEEDALDSGDVYISKKYSYNYTDAAALFWCKQGMYLFRWHSDIGGNYLYPMNNILPDYSYNNEARDLDKQEGRVLDE